MKKLIIMGLAGDPSPADYPDCEVWTVGRNHHNGASKYFELHGLDFYGHKMERPSKSVYDFAHTFNLPINNTICYMLVLAHILGYTDIKIVGSPLIAKNEYIKERPAVAYLIGYMSAFGAHIEWLGGIDNIDYGYERL